MYVYVSKNNNRLSRFNTNLIFMYQLIMLIPVYFFETPSVLTNLFKKLFTNNIVA